MVAGSSNGCPKVSSKSSGGSIKAKGEKREYWLRFARWKGWRRSWRMRERGKERGGGIKEEFCMSDYLERRRPFVTSRTLLPSKNHSTSWRAFIGGLRRDLRRDIASGRRGRGREGEGRE